MQIVLRVLAIIFLIPIGLAGALLAAASILSFSGETTPDLLIDKILLGWGWLIGGMIAYGCYLGLVWVFRGSEDVSKTLGRLRRNKP